MSTKEFIWGKLWPSLRADNSATLVMPNVNVMIEAEYFIHTLNLHELLRVRYTLRYCRMLNLFLYTPQGLSSISEKAGVSQK